jgi:hypothetical protein
MYLHFLKHLLREKYMTIPKGFKIEQGQNEDYMLKLHRNVYGQKQASRVWNQHLTKILMEKLGFEQSKNDEIPPLKQPNQQFIVGCSRITVELSRLQEF